MRCAYVRHLWDCGESLEIEEKHTGRYGARGQKREKRKKASPEDIKRQNKWKRERDLRRLIKWNFGKYDYWMTITYRKGDRPAWEQMKKDVTDLIKKIRKRYRKLGKELKYIYRLQIGKRGGPHVHILVNRIQTENTGTDILRYVGHEYLHWPELCHVRKDHRVLPEKCPVLAETDAPVKRIFHHGSQGRQPSDHPKRRKRKLLLHIRRQG